jgi:hypothetical protein
MGVLAGGEPMSCREIIRATGLSRSQVYNALYRCWRRGLVLRTARSLLSHERVFKGRGGVTRHVRPFHLYLLRPEGVGEVVVGGHRYVGFSEEYLDPRGGGGLSKAKRVLGFLEENADSAFFSRYVVDARARGWEEEGLRGGSGVGGESQGVHASDHVCVELQMRVGEQEAYG